MYKKWYLAELLEEFRASDKGTSLLHINWVLVNASDAEKAYEKALEFGQELNREYYNTEGILVVVKFRGLRDLNEIHEELSDGSELVYEEIEEISSIDIERMKPEKEGLSVFKLK